MNASRTRAIILRSRHFGEADRVVTVISEEAGIFDAKIKGARKPKSKLGPACQQFSTVELSLFTGRSMDTVTEASLQRSSESIERDIVRLTYASLVAELTLKMSAERQPDPRAYQLVDGALGAVGGGMDPRAAASAFMIKRLYIDGMMPQLACCSMCRAKDDLLWFSPETGGALCPRCAAEAPGVMRFGADAKALAVTLYRSTWDQMSAMAFEDEAAGELEAALSAMFEFRGDIRIRSLETLELIRDAGRGGGR